MQHAYLHVTCGAANRSNGYEYDTYRSFESSHGWYFRWLLNHVDIRAHRFLNTYAMRPEEGYTLNIEYEHYLMIRDAIYDRASYREPNRWLRDLGQLR